MESKQARPQDNVGGRTVGKGWGLGVAGLCNLVLNVMVNENKT